MDSPAAWVTTCCDARPVGEIEFDGVDGDDGNMVAVSYSTCGECGKFSSVTITGGWNELRRYPLGRGLDASR